MDLKAKLLNKKAKIGVIGLGYVGLPLIREFLNAGFHVMGFDVDLNKIKKLKKGKSYIRHISNQDIRRFNTSKRFKATSDFSELTETDAILICVPTPLNRNREPDLSYVLEATRSIARYLRKGQLVVLESTTYPGTTEEEVLPLLEKSGLKAGSDFHLAFSPEREDPGNKEYNLKNVPKVVSGVTPRCLKLADTLYSQVVMKTVPVSSPRVAEAAKLLENIYRAINIAMVNELKMIFDRMDIDVFEVIEATRTKPFGYHPFYPGPGLGGHCIPIDPFYLSWKARQYDYSTRFIELAGEINTNMPYYVVSKSIEAVNRQKKSIKGAKVLVLGLAYKKDIDDQRESPAHKIISLFSEKGAKVSYHDPYIPIYNADHQGAKKEMRSVKLTRDLLKRMDCVIIVTDHSCVDYKFVVKNAPLVVDTRNVTREIKSGREKIFYS